MHLENVLCWDQIAFILKLRDLLSQALQSPASCRGPCSQQTRLLPGFLVGSGMSPAGETAYKVENIFPVSFSAF